MSTSKNFVLGVSTGIAGIGIKTLLNILVYPYVLRKLGIEKYGLYVLLLNLVDLIVLMDMGLTSGIIQSLSSARAKLADEEAKQILSGGLILYSLLACLSFLICFSLIPHISAFFGFSHEITIIATFCLYVILLEGTLTLFQGYFSAVLIAHTRYQWVNTSESLYFLISNGGIFVLLHLGYGLQQIALLRLGSAVIKFILIFFHAVRIDADCIKPFFFNLKKSIEVLKISLHAMVRTVSDIFSSRMDLILIGRFLSLPAVAMQEFIYRFLNLVMQLPIQVANTVFPVFAILKASQDNANARLLFLRLSCFINFSVILLLSILCFYYHDIFTFFSGGRISFEKSVPLFILALPGIISMSLSFPASQYLFAVGKFRLITTSCTITSLLRFVMVILLIHRYGLIGVIFSTLAMSLVYHQILLIRSTCKDLSIGLIHYVSQVYFLILPALLVSLSGIYLLKQAQQITPIHPMAQPLITAAIVIPAGYLIWYFTTASRQERDLVKKTVHRISRKLLTGRELETALS